MGVRLSNLLPSKARLEIRYPDENGEPTGLVLTVVGKESAEYFDAMNKLLDQAQAQDPEKKLSTKEAWMVLAEQVSAHIVGWEGLLDDDDKPIPFSSEKALELISDAGMFYVRKQVEEFAKQRTNFFRQMPPAVVGGGEPKRQPKRK